MTDKESGDNKTTLRCSFCGKSQHDVKKLIAGPDVFICNECIKLCSEVVKNEVQTSLFSDDEKSPRPKDILDILDQIARRVISMNFKDYSTTKLKNSIYSNVIMLGLAVREFDVIFNEKELMITILRDFFGDSKENLDAFEMGFNLIKNY